MSKWAWGGVGPPKEGPKEEVTELYTHKRNIHKLPIQRIQRPAGIIRVSGFINNDNDKVHVSDTFDDSAFEPWLISVAILCFSTSCLKPCLLFWGFV